MKTQTLLITISAIAALVAGCSSSGPRQAAIDSTAAPPFAIDRNEGAPANPEQARPTGPVTDFQSSNMPGESGLDNSSSSLSGGGSGSGGGPGG